MICPAIIPRAPFPSLCQAVIGMSCILAFCLNYTIFLNTSLNSALTQTMCGNLKVRPPFLLHWLASRARPRRAVDFPGPSRPSRPYTDRVW